MSVELRFFTDAKILAIAGEHGVLLDRDKPQGGDNSGFRARELWLTSLLACASGTLKAQAAQTGIEQAITSAQGELSLNEQGDIARVSLQFSFAAEVTAVQQQGWLQSLRERCFLLKTLHPAIELQLRTRSGAIGAQPLSGEPAAAEPHQRCALSC